MKIKWFYRGMLFMGVVLLSSCSSSSYSVKIKDSSDIKNSIEVYLFGLKSDSLNQTKISSYDDFWLRVFKSNGQFPSDKRGFYFGTNTNEVQYLNHDDPIWSVWKDSDMEYFCIAVYYSDFTDSDRDSDDNWKKIIPIKHYNWLGMGSEKLEIDIKDQTFLVEEK